MYVTDLKIEKLDIANIPLDTVIEMSYPVYLYYNNYDQYHYQDYHQIHYQDYHQVLHKDKKDHPIDYHQTLHHKHHHPSKSKMSYDDKSLWKSDTILQTYDNWYIYPEAYKLHCTQMSSCIYGTLLFNDFIGTFFTLFLIYLFIYACTHIPKSFKKAKKFKIHVKKRDKNSDNKEIEDAEEVERIIEKTRQLEEV